MSQLFIDLWSATPSQASPPPVEERRHWAIKGKRKCYRAPDWQQQTRRVQSKVTPKNTVTEGTGADWQELRNGIAVDAKKEGK